MKQEGAQGTGTARATRTRKARTQARHVLWLHQQYQLVASHHTSPVAASMMADMQADLAALRREMDELRKTREDTGARQENPQQEEEQKNQQEELAEDMEQEHATNDDHGTNAAMAAEADDAEPTEATAGEGMLVRITSEVGKMLAECRAAGINEQKNERRMQWAGMIGKVVEVDQTDNTAQVRLRCWDSLWYPLPALIPIRAVQDDSSEENEIETSEDTTEEEFASRGEETADDGANDDDSVSKENTPRLEEATGTTVAPASRPEAHPG